MASKLEPIVIRGLNRGMADDQAVADSMMPLSQVRLAYNLDTETIGFLKRRSGYSRLGSAAVVTDSDILGLHHHVGTNSQVVSFATNGSTMESYYLSGTTWINKALGFAPDTRVHTVSFLDYVFAVNGTSNPRSWSGDASSSWGTNNLSSAPTGSLIALYKQQLYIGSTSTDQINFSSVPTSSAITWSASDNFILNPNDSSNLTAFVPFAQELIFWKDDYFYRYNASAVSAEPIMNYGTPSQESVLVEQGICWFYDANRRAIFAYAGGSPTLISQPVVSFVQAVPSGSATSVIGRSSNDTIEFFLGNLTVNSVAFSNVAVRMHIPTQTWSIRSYANTFTAFAKYDDGTDRQFLGGTSVGDVVKMDSGNQDLSTDIEYRLETQWYSLGNNPAVLFRLGAFGVFVENAGSLSVQYKTDIDNTWRPIGSARGFVTSWDGINADFHKIKFRFVGVSSSDSVIFDGFSILAPVLQGVETDTEDD